MNLFEIFTRFPTHETCIAYLEKVRWGDEPHCPNCGSLHVACKSDGARIGRWNCHGCKSSFNVLQGTIFQKTKIPLQKWFMAISLILNAKKGVSSFQLARDLDMNQKSAWFMAMRIRRAMQDHHTKLLTGIVEMDETYIGGKPRKGKHYDDPDDKPKRGRGTKKTPVVGAIERKGAVSAQTVNKGKMKREDMQAYVQQFVDTTRTHLVTDEYSGYQDMRHVLPHSVVRHSQWYVDGDIHTNTIESFWAILKRGIFGQFHSVSPKHLQRYVDEFCYRYNLCKHNRQDIFELTIARGLGI
ncbi:MAG: IS1595 family transposase [Pseudomonadota bacterium]